MNINSNLFLKNNLTQEIICNDQIFKIKKMYKSDNLIIINNKNELFLYKLFKFYNFNIKFEYPIFNIICFKNIILLQNNNYKIFLYSNKLKLIGCNDILKFKPFEKIKKIKFNGFKYNLIIVSKTINLIYLCKSEYKIINNIDILSTKLDTDLIKIYQKIFLINNKFYCIAIDELNTIILIIFEIINNNEYKIINELTINNKQSEIINHTIKIVNINNQIILFSTNIINIYNINTLELITTISNITDIKLIKEIESKIIIITNNIINICDLKNDTIRLENKYKFTKNNIVYININEENNKLIVITNNNMLIKINLTTII